MVKKSAKIEKEKKEVKKAKDTSEKKQVEKKDNKKKNTKAVKPKKKFLSGFKSEFSKIKWPTRKEMVKYSIATIAFVIFFSLFFLAIQSLMSLLLRVI